MKGKHLAGLLMGVGGLSFGLYFFTRGREVRRFANNLSVSVDFNSKLPNLQEPHRQISVPVDITFRNNSAEAVEVRLNSAKILDGRGKAWADVDPTTGRHPFTIARYQTTTITIDFIYPTGLAYWGAKLASVSIAAINGKLQEYIDELLGLFKQDFRVRLDVKVDGLPITHELALSGHDYKQEKKQGVGLVSTARREIRPKSDYIHLIPAASCLKRTDPYISHATPSDTARYMRKIARRDRGDVARLAQSLQRDTLRDTLENIYRFVYRYIRYARDSETREEVRTPLRTLHDQTGDCDCFSTLIASLLESLEIPYRVRIAEYKHRGYFQHVYIVVPAADAPRGYWVVDPVVEGFDYEEPYSRIKDL